MKLVSVNTGLAREVKWHGRIVNDGDLQGGGWGTGGGTQAESGRGRAGGLDGTWERAQGGLLLLAGALRLPEERVARARTADGDVWGKFYD